MNTLVIKNPCPRCGQPLPEGAERGLCPKCLLAGVVAATEADPPVPEPAAPPIESVRAAFPKLEVLELIGMGGMGVVYKARQPQLDRLVALKLLPSALAVDPAFTERFNREARLLARLNHPNIVAVYDFGQAGLPGEASAKAGGFFYLLMEFVDGVNLRQAMAAGRFTPAQALEIVPKVCAALQFAHEEGILHRDIKPENILLDAKGRVKIADFGIAKLIGARKEATLTASRMAIGTPHYMAPEQLERPQDVDQRADIYSLGVVFYEMLTGELPIGRFAPPSRKSPVDTSVDDAVLRALEKERERRYRSADEMKTRVEGLHSAPPVGRAGPSAPAPGVAQVSEPADYTSPGPGTWSKKAISGAVMAGLGLLALALSLVPLWLSSSMQGGLGTAELLILCVLGLVPVAMLVAASALGGVAMGDIRRSAGLLRGRSLAVGAALCGPLLAFNSLLMVGLVLASPTAVLPAVPVLFGLNVWAGWQACRWTSGPSGRAGFGGVLTAVACAVGTMALPILVPAVIVLVPETTMEGSRGAVVTPSVSTAARLGYEVEFTLPPNQVAVFEVVARTNRVLVPLPELGMYLINSAPEACGGKFIWADNPKDLDLEGKPRWRFGIVSTNGNTLAEGLGVPKPPPGFHSSTDAWVALEPDKEKVLGLPPGDPSRPAHGLRIRTQSVRPQPGLRRHATGFGTNWTEMLSENPSNP